MRATRSLPKRLVAEAVGTGLLLATIVGSGIMAEDLSAGNHAVALLCNALATGAGLVALILALGPISGAHFNPVVTLADAWAGRLGRREAALYIAVQCAAAVLGVWLAHAMFDRPLLMVSGHARSGAAQGLSELVATFGLLLTILGTSARRADAVPFAVAAYIVAAYWFTASTSFANPAVTLARSLTDTFAGIRPADVPLFVSAQFAGGGLALGLFGWLRPTAPPEDCVLPRGRASSEAGE
jgi:glycerol uptake facilitator-like aquaporin